jgi:hypothetical protein
VVIFLRIRLATNGGAILGYIGGRRVVELAVELDATRGSAFAAVLSIWLL